MAWAATTAGVDHGRKPGDILSFLVEDNIVIEKGNVVRIDAAGYATAETPAVGDMAAGIALETVDNTVTGHTAGGKSISVLTEGVVNLLKDTAVIGDVGTAAFCSSTVDANTVDSGAFTLANASLCGAFTGLVYDPVTGIASGSQLWVKLRCLQHIKTA